MRYMCGELLRLEGIRGDYVKTAIGDAVCTYQSDA